MTANELMIGDYVIRKNVTNEFLTVVAIDSIRGIVYLDLDGLGITEKLENIEPIPISPKILEKIGFVKQAYDGWLISENNGRRLIEYRTDYFDGLLRINYAEEPFSELTIKAKYFHELQHALRLCGIEKPIEL